MRIRVLGSGAMYDTVYDALKDAGHEMSPLPDAELVVCVRYPYTVTPEDLAKPKHGYINVHTSLLPRYRGRHPVVWALLNDEREIGITVHFMNEHIDEGDIVLQDSTLVEPDDDYNSVLEDLIKMSGPITVAAVKQIECGCVYRRLQWPQLATHPPRRTPDNSEIPKKASTTLRLYVRALPKPLPVPYFKVGEKKYVIQETNE